MGNMESQSEAGKGAVFQKQDQQVGQHTEDAHNVAPTSDESGDKLNMPEDGEYSGGQMRMILVKDTTVKLHQLPPTAQPDLTWYADLTIHFKDITYVMRDGLHFSSENVIPEENYIQNTLQGPDAWAKKLGWTCCRVYPVIDRSQVPQWQGSLRVFALKKKELSGFRVSNLSIENIDCATARNAKDQDVYYFDCKNDEENYNAVYDDMPMKGFWPWPREQGTGEENLINLV